MACLPSTLIKIMNVWRGYDHEIVYKTRWKRSQYGLLPKRYIIDGVDFLRHKATGTDVGEKRLYGDIDAGYISINATAGLSGEVVYRKVTSTTAAGQSILMDTNNSSNDFQVSTTIAPRTF